MLPVTDTLEPVITPPTTLAPVTAPDTDTLVPVITPPTTDAAVTAPEADTAPAVLKLPPVMLPVTLRPVVMFTLPVPFGVNTMLALTAEVWISN